MERKAQRFDDTEENVVFGGSLCPKYAFLPPTSTNKGNFTILTDGFISAGILTLMNCKRKCSLGYNNGKIVVKELEKGYLKRFKKPIYIYKLPQDQFEFEEHSRKGLFYMNITSKNYVKPIGVIKFDNALSMLKNFEDLGRVEVVLFSEKSKEEEKVL